MKIERTITNINRYPTTGEHQECLLHYGIIGDNYKELPFEIRKGEDEYWYIDKNGKELSYNGYKTKLDQRWIVNIEKECYNISLNKIFDIEVNKSLDRIVEYCINIYKKSLVMEKDRIIKEMDIFKL